MTDHSSQPLPEGAEAELRQLLQAEDAQPSAELDAVIMAAAADRVAAMAAVQEDSARSAGQRNHAWWRSAPSLAAAAAVVLAVGVWWQLPDPTLVSGESPAQVSANASAKASANASANTPAVASAVPPPQPVLAPTAADPDAMMADAGPAPELLLDVQADVQAEVREEVSAAAKARQTPQRALASSAGSAEADDRASPGYWARLGDSLNRKFARSQRYTTVRRSAAKDPALVLDQVLTAARMVLTEPVAAGQDSTARWVNPARPLVGFALAPGQPVTAYFFVGDIVGDNAELVQEAVAGSDGLVRVPVPDQVVNSLVDNPGELVRLYLLDPAAQAAGVVNDTWAGPVPGGLAVVTLGQRAMANLPADQLQAAAVLFQANMLVSALDQLDGRLAERPDDPDALLLQQLCYFTLGAAEGAARARAALAALP